MNLRKLKNQAGFTLVELIVVIAIMAILAGVAVPVYSGYIEKANKAADLQLLGAVNAAFAAACIENDTDVHSIEAENGKPQITNYENITVSVFNEEFQVYFAGNEGGFKVFDAKNPLLFANGAFQDPAMVSPEDGANKKYPQGAGMTDDEIDAAVGKYEASNFNGKVDELAGSVDNLAGMLSDKISTQGSEALLKDHMDALGEGEYDAFMKKYGLTEDSTDAEIANATVMYVADKLSGTTASDVQAIMAESGPQGIINEYGSITTAAMMYGLMTGYSNSSYGTNYTLSQPQGVNEVLGEFMTLYNNDSQFKEYFNTSTSGGMADMDGFLAAMDVVNNYEGSFNLKDENLFVSDETNDLLTSILGASSSN